MSTQEASFRVSASGRDSLRVCVSAAFAYGAGLWIVVCNPYMLSEIFRIPIDTSNLSPLARSIYAPILFVLGRTPIECIARVAAVALLVQVVNAFFTDREDGQSGIDIEHYRPYVFWRAIYRFLSACGPFVSGRRTDAPPSTWLTEYERITIRYVLVKLIFMPMMITFFFNNLQLLAYSLSAETPIFDLSSPASIRHLYLTLFWIMMTLDTGWFALGCSMETGRYSPIKMVDPYASGWLITLACYPPLLSISSQFLIWRMVDFPAVSTRGAALFFALAGLFLYGFYVVSDLCFGLKTGNLTYRGVVDKGPYKLIRHPMYASKNCAWFLFTLPAIGFHLSWAHLPFIAAHLMLPYIGAQWGMVWPMLAWMSIYALRGITEERYLLEFPEYRDYCKRVRYRFIPGVI